MRLSATRTYLHMCAKENKNAVLIILTRLRFLDSCAKYRTLPHVRHSWNVRMTETETVRPYVVALSASAMYGWNVEAEGLSRLLTVVKGRVIFCEGYSAEGKKEKYALEALLVVEEGADMYVPKAHRSLYAQLTLRSQSHPTRSACFAHGRG